MEISHYVTLVKHGDVWDIYTSQDSYPQNYFEFVFDFELPFKVFGIKTVDAWVARMENGEPMVIVIDQNNLFVEINMTVNNPWSHKV